MAEGQQWWARWRPQEWLAHVGCRVTVQVKGSTVPLEGYFFSIDPELHHLMLLRTAARQSMERIVVMGHAVTSVEFGSDRMTVAIEEDDVSRLLSNVDALRTSTSTASPISGEAIQHRKAVVCQLLEKAHIPHQEDGGTIVVMNGVASIDPPYNSSSCRSRNEIVLQRLQSILSTLVPV